MSNLIAFLKKYLHVLVFIILQVTAIVMLYNSMNYPRYALASATKTIAAPVNKLCYNIERHFNLFEENKQLVKQNLKLLENRDENFFTESDTMKTAYFEEVDTARNRTIRTRMYDYTTAGVVYNTIHKKNNYLMLDKGSMDGVVCDMAVLSPNGVIGIVSDVSPHFATVTSLLNSSTRISAKVLPVNQLGTIAWHFGDPSCVYLEDIPEHININVGDSVYTSGYSDIFPNNVLIGVVCEKSKTSASSFLSLKVKLTTDFNHINTVYLVRNLYKEELEGLKSKMGNE